MTDKHNGHRQRGYAAADCCSRRDFIGDLGNTQEGLQ
jgi:hypothetical protein